MGCFDHAASSRVRHGWYIPGVTSQPRLPFPVGRIDCQW